MAIGATDGQVTDMGPNWLLTFSDLDDGRHEVAWVVPGSTYDDALWREEWTTVEI